VQWQVNVLQNGVSTKLEVQTFKGFAYRRAIDYQLKHIHDTKRRQQLQRSLGKGTTYQEQFHTLLELIDEPGFELLPRIHVTPVFTEKKVQPTPPPVKINLGGPRLRRGKIEEGESTTGSEEEDLVGPDYEYEALQRVRSHIRTRRLAKADPQQAHEEPREHVVKIRRGPKITPLPPFGPPPTTKARWYRRIW